MNRLIFRGKRVDNGEWVRGHYFTFEECMNGIHHLSHRIGDLEDNFSVITETVGQCTGLSDKNEKLIFEGNVVKWNNEHKTPIIWDSEYACFRRDDHEGMSNYRNEWEAKIVGNIHTEVKDEN